MEESSYLCENVLWGYLLLSAIAVSEGTDEDFQVVKVWTDDMDGDGNDRSQIILQ